MSKTRKKDLVKRRQRLNRQQGKMDDSGLRVDSSHLSADASRYEVDQIQLLRGDLSFRRVEGLLAEAIERDDVGIVRLAAQGLIDLHQADGEVYAISGLSAMTCGLVHIALTDLRRACRVGESGPMVAQALEALPTVEQAAAMVEYPETLSRLYSPEQLIEASYQNDRVQELMQHRRFDLAQKFAERALKLYPQFLPLQNNVVHLAIASGDFEKARLYAAAAIGDHPDDVFAIGNVAMLDWIGGDLANCCRRLDAVNQIPQNRREAMSHLLEVTHKANQPQRLLDIWEANESIQDEMQAEYFARDAKLAAWAYGRLGNLSAALAVLERVAVRWRDDCHWELVEDLELPEDYQVGISPLPDVSWLPRQLINAMKSEVDDIAQVRRLMQSFVDRYPSVLEGVIERGPSASRRLMLQTCFDATKLSPQVLDALAAFASGRWGPLVDRLIARAVLHLHGRSVQRIWAGGDWLTDEFAKLELHVESTKPATRTDEVNELIVTALDHLHSQRPAQAERCYRKALSSEPHARDLRGNLITAVAVQGRDSEVDQMVAELYRDFPDYLFAQTHWASYLIRQGRLDEAETLLREITADRSRWHVTESTAYAQVVCQLWDVRDSRRAAEPFRQWVQACHEYEKVMRSLNSTSSHQQRQS